MKSTGLKPGMARGVAIFTLLFNYSFGVSPVSAHGTNLQIVTDTTYRYFRSHSILNHVTGTFPNAGNPNAILPQELTYRASLYSVARAKATPGWHPFGMAVNGVLLDPGTAELWNFMPAWQYEAIGGSVNLGLDMNNAHVQPGGTYHYHGIPTGLVGTQDTTAHSMLVGFAADGFPIYSSYSYSDPWDSTSAIVKISSSYRFRQGSRPEPYYGPGGNYDGTFVADYEYISGLGDLDECNGRYGSTPDFPKGTYYYVLTDSFPYIPRYFRGTPDITFVYRFSIPIPEESTIEVEAVALAPSNNPVQVEEVESEEPSQEDCLITRMKPQSSWFRQLRDVRDVLLSYPLGSLFVQAYYSLTIG